MSRLSFRPRPVDFLKKLPLLKSVKDFEDEETPTSTRNCQLLRFAAEADNEAHHTPTKKVASEIPIPESVTVDTYRVDYSPTFIQPTSYLRGRGACAKLGEFVEYDLDNEDEDWLEELNKERRILAAEMFEALLYKLEVLDHKARERAGVITPTLGSPIPVLLQVDAAIEALQSQSIQYGIFQTVYNYWKQKRELWQKPILRHLQPPPPVTDTNPYNVFRPREKAHRLHTRRMQRRENNVQSFERLRQVRRNLDQAKFLLEALIKREEKKRDVMESEVSLQNIQLKYKHETELLEDSLAASGFTTNSCKFGSSDEDSDEIENTRPAPLQNPHFSEYSVGVVNAENTKQELRRQNAQQQQGWLHKVDPLEPVLLFSKPLVPEKLGAAGIVAPVDSSGRNGRFNGRIGRGGRIVFDRWNPFSHTSIDLANPSYVPPKPQPSTCN